MPLDAPRSRRAGPPASPEGPPVKWGQLLAVLVAIAACCTGIALLVDTEPDDEAEVALGADGNPVGEREEYEREREALMRSARPLANLEGLERAFEGAGPGFYGNGSLELDEARSYFDEAMKHLETLAGRGRRLQQDEWKEAYRVANDAFVALEIHLDPKSDKKHRTELEDAHKRLKASLAALRVRGGKFRPR